MKNIHAKRTGTGIALSVLMMSAFLPANIAFAAEEPRFELRPHCSDADVAKNACKPFATRDPQSFQTDTLNVGDTLDLDLLIQNPGNASISRFSAWMGYDPTIFSGSTITIDKNFPTPNAVETVFSTTDGYIKANASSAAGAKGTTIVAAHFTLKILKAPISSTVISFFDSTKKPTSHSAIIVKVNSQEQNIASTNQSYLFVKLKAGGVASSVASSSAAVSQATTSVSSASSADTSSIAMSSASSLSSTGTVASSSAATQNSSTTNIAFSVLQVQGLRVTTDGSSAFLAWNQLSAGNILGYNVYYGTVSGKYIQRRSIDKNNTTLTIRNLPVGTQYFFAVRGVNANNQESDFSQEVAVTIGNPSTSTSPLTGNVSDLGPGGKNPANGGTVAGATGPTSTALLFIALSSVAGIMLAFRRQFTAKNISLS